MADWKQIPDTDVDPDAPVTSELMYALRDNPVAIAEGAVGAPRIVDAALDAGAGTALGANWVGKRSALMAWNAIGSYVMARGTTNQSPGTIISGSNMQAADVANGVASGALPGTWMLQGRTGATGVGQVSIWKRVT